MPSSFYTSSSTVRKFELNFALAIDLETPPSIVNPKLLLMVHTRPKVLKKNPQASAQTKPDLEIIRSRPQIKRS